MKTATIAELHEHLDEYLDLVWAGESVEIQDEKGNVAQLVAKPKLETKGLDVEALIAAGKLRRVGSGKLPDDFFSLPRAQFSSGNLSDVLRQEREEGW